MRLSLCAPLLELVRVSGRPPRLPLSVELRLVLPDQSGKVNQILRRARENQTLSGLLGYGAAVLTFGGGFYSTRRLVANDGIPN